MKKVTAILVALMLTAMTAVTAFAAGINAAEQAVLDEISASSFISGFANDAENYFNTIEMTADESSQIIAIIKEGNSYYASTGAKSVDDLTYEQKEQLFNYGQSAVGVLGMTMSYDKTSKTVTIYAPDGTVVFTGTPTDLAGGGSSNGGSSNGGSTGIVDSNIIKTTGADVNFSGIIAVSAAAVLLMAGGALYLVKSKRERV